MNLFLAQRYAAVIILLVGTVSDPRHIWCNAPLSLCNQAQTKWLKVLLQLPARKALTHQCNHSHSLQTPLGSTYNPKTIRPAISSTRYKSLSESIDFFLPPPPLYQVSRTVGLLGFGTDGIAAYRIPKNTSKVWFENGLQTSHFYSSGFHNKILRMFSLHL